MKIFCEKCGSECKKKPSEIDKNQHTFCSRQCKSGNFVGKISGSYFNKIKESAKARNIEFSVSHDYLWNLYQSQNGLCKYSGIPIDFPVTRKDLARGNMTVSLDRMDSTLGYIEGNLCWCHKRINIMKSTMTTEEFLFFCDSIVSHQRRCHP